MLTGLSDREGFKIKDLEVNLPREDEQIGFFLPTSTSIKIFLITRPNATNGYVQPETPK